MRSSPWAGVRTALLQTIEKTLRNRRESRSVIGLWLLMTEQREDFKLPTTLSAEKRVRQNEKRRLRNRVYRTRARTLVKRTRRLVAEGELEAAEQVALQACRALDKAASRGVIHKNSAARRKSRLMKHLNKVKAATLS